MSEIDAMVADGSVDGVENAGGCEVKAPNVVEYVSIPIDEETMLPKLPDEELLSWMESYEPPVEVYSSLKSASGRFLYVDESRFSSEESWWFVGDVHGDIRALGSIVSHVRSRGLGPERIVFLGDMFDRNAEDGGLETLRAFLTLLHDAGDRVLWIAGNHDAILTYDEEAARFKVSTNRSEFAEYLNDHPELHEFGRKLTALIARLPVALCFSSGLIAVHGGVPHTDVIEKIENIDDLECKECIDDFLWGRMTSAKFKFPDRMSRGHELGYEDFEKFSEKIKSVLKESGVDMKFLSIVCGHQHLFTDGIGYQILKNYPVYPPSVCLYSSFSLEPASAWGTSRRISVPCVLHWQGNTAEILGFDPTEGGALQKTLLDGLAVKTDVAEDLQEG